MDIDPRNRINGLAIPTRTYSDQPYIIKTEDNAWLCSVTTGVGEEGEPGQTIATMRSENFGKSWSEPVLVEPPNGPEASYSVLLKTSFGRIYCFYNHNTDNIREVVADDPPYEKGICKRVDSLGYYVFKYSDDNGKSWSKKRHVVPVREFEIDRKNFYGGKIRFFWNVGKPFTLGNDAFVPLVKCGGFGKGFFTSNEGILLKSDNILFEKNPEKINWETLPEGETGLKTPPGGGGIAGEHSYVVLSDGTIYSVYRTIDGYPVFAYSRDGGYKWSVPEYKKYADGRLIKHPRAANFVWKCQNGKYLYWFHNHGGHFISEMNDDYGMRPYDDRNPVWLCGGIEIDTPEGKTLVWSQPEIILYDDDPRIRMSYPDLVEHEGEYYLTETQKSEARLHKIDIDIVEGLWRQFEDKAETVKTGLILESELYQNNILELPIPELPAFTERDCHRPDMGTKDLRQGFSIDLWIKFFSLNKDQVIIENRDYSGKGFAIQTTFSGTIELILNDGRTESRWQSDSEFLKLNQAHHIVIVIDGGPKIISFVIDGKFCDGAESRQFGWGRFNPNMYDVNASETLVVNPTFEGIINKIKIYKRYLKVYEIINNYKIEKNEYSQ